MNISVYDMLEEKNREIEKYVYNMKEKKHPARYPPV